MLILVLKCLWKSKEGLKCENGEVAIDTSTGFIKLPSDFCLFSDSKEELIKRAFPNIAQQLNNNNWLSKQVIFAAKNKDVADL